MLGCKDGMENYPFWWRSCADKVGLAGSSVIKQMEMILADFCWGKKEDKTQIPLDQVV